MGKSTSQWWGWGVEGDRGGGVYCLLKHFFRRQMRLELINTKPCGLQPVSGVAVPTLVLFGYWPTLL